MKNNNAGEKIEGGEGNMWMTLDKGIWVDLSGKVTCEQRPECSQEGRNADVREE